MDSGKAKIKLKKRKEVELNLYGTDGMAKWVSILTSTVSSYIRSLTCGVVRFRTITSSFFRGADGLILMFDVTNKNSFAFAKRFREVEFERYLDDTVPIILVGNKADLVSKRVFEL